MPEKAHRAAEAKGRKLGYTGKRLERYIYGALRRTGWKPRRKRRKHRSNAERAYR